MIDAFMTLICLASALAFMVGFGIGSYTAGRAIQAQENKNG